MNPRIAPWALSILILLPSHGAGLRADTTALEVEQDNSLDSALVTPHKAWGKGYTGGSVRALFFVYTGPYAGTWEDTGTRVREVVELGQRFDLQADAALFCGKGNEKWVFHGLEFGQTRAERLLQKPYDLYVIAGFPMAKLPAKFQYLILKQVADGAGLLCCGQGAPEYMAPKRLIDPLPAALAKGLPVLDGKTSAQMAKAYRLGKGRGVWLSYGAHALTPHHAFSWRNLAEYDYWMLLVGRAALWAASRDSGASVESVLGSEPLVTTRGQETAGQVAIASTAAEPLPVEVDLELCRATDGLRTSLGSMKATLSAGETTRLSVPLPRLRADDYLLDAIVRSARGVEAFGAGCLTIQSDVGVDRVELSDPFVEVGDTIKGTAFLKGSPPQGSLLQVRFRDSYDRVLVQRDMSLSPDDTQQAFEYVADAFATNLMRVQAALVVGGEEVQMAQASFYVPKRRQHRFNFVMWDTPKDVLGPYAWRQLQKAGMNTSLIGSMGGVKPPPSSLSACDATIAPYSTRIQDPKDAQGYMEPVCWNDEPAVDEYVQKIVDNQALLRQQGVFVYSLGDEGVTKGCCVHPACIAAYRVYLEEQYGTIQGLNGSWGTEYASFEQVDLLDRADNMETGAKKTCYPRWYDRQAFARYNLSRFVGRFVRAYRELDPASLCGYEGTGNFGDDYDAILSTNEFYGPYPSIGDDIIRSAAPREMVRSNWMGYSKTGDALSDAAWRMVMKGMDSIWYWMWSGIGDWRGYLRPTLDFWPAISDVAEEMRPVRQGLGDLLLRSEMTHSGIAVFYSVPSALSCQLGEGPGFVSAKATHETWTQLTYELGLDFAYVTSAMVKRGELDSGEYQMLLLPMAEALDAEEVAAIRGFVEKGGTVVADVRPGIYDGHCKVMTPGVLDDLFGIERVGRDKPTELPLELKGSLGERALDVDLGPVRLDTGVRADGAEALATVQDTPVMLVNSTGAGRTILLNFQLLPAKPDAPSAKAARRLLMHLYGLTGARRLIGVASPSGEPLPATETRVWRNADALVFGLWRQMQNAWFSPKSGTVGGAPVPAQIMLRTPKHVYELRSHKYLGRTDRVGTDLQWGRAAFYLALPYEIGKLDVSVSPSPPQPGEAITAAISLGVPQGANEKFAVWVQATDPSGAEVLWARQVVLLQEGEGTVQLPIAHNDAAGTWRVKVTELFSNQSAEGQWVIP